MVLLDFSAALSDCLRVNQTPAGLLDENMGLKPGTRRSPVIKLHLKCRFIEASGSVQQIGGCGSA